MSDVATEAKRSVRVTLTAAQLDTPEGAALLSLCQRVTADGEVTDTEVEEIRAWVKQNESAGVVGTAFLGKTLARIMADDKLDPYERQELQEALERILPKKHRDLAIAARRAVELKRFKEAPEPVVEESEPEGDVFDFMVAGVAYEGRIAVIEEFVHPEACAHLWRDKDNKFSPNAIAVRTGSGLMVGYVPEWHAEQMAPLLDEGYGCRAYFKKILIGYRGPTPVVVAMLYPPGAVAAGEPCCESAIAFLRAANPKTGDEAVGVINAFAARTTKEARFDGAPTLNDLERMISFALEVRPAVRDLLGRSEAARPLEGTFETLMAAVDNMAGSVHDGLERIQNSPPNRNDRARADRLLQMIGAAPVARKVVAEVPTRVEEAHSAPLRFAKPEAETSPLVFVALGVVAVIAVVFAILASR